VRLAPPDTTRIVAGVGKGWVELRGRIQQRGGEEEEGEEEEKSGVLLASLTVHSSFP
jgi:hypothetical protein